MKIIVVVPAGSVLWTLRNPRRLRRMLVEWLAFTLFVVLSLVAVVKLVRWLAYHFG